MTHYGILDYLHGLESSSDTCPDCRCLWCECITGCTECGSETDLNAAGYCLTCVEEIDWAALGLPDGGLTGGADDNGINEALAPRRHAA